MRKDAHNFRKAVHLTDIKELKDFHFEPKASINEEQCLK